MYHSSDIMFRKGTMDDLNTIDKLFQDAIVEMNKNHIFQWDEKYPDKEVLKEDIRNKQLYVGKISNKTCSVFVLNQETEEQYVNGAWRFPDLPFYAIHRLCVNPAFQNQGIGTKTIMYAEDILREQGIDVIRLDAFCLNPYALKMYASLDYNIVGEAHWRTGTFYLMEKRIDRSKP